METKLNPQKPPKERFRNIAISLLIFLLVSLTGKFLGGTFGHFAGSAEQESLKTFSVGKIANNSYTNDYIGLSLSLPSEWRFRTEKELVTLMNVTDEVFDKKFEHPKYDFVAFREKSSELISLCYTTGNYNNTTEYYLISSLDDIVKEYTELGLKVTTSPIDDVKLGKRIYKHADIMITNASSNSLACQSAYLTLIDNSLVTIVIHSTNQYNKEYEKFFEE